MEIENKDFLEAKKQILKMFDKPSDFRRIIFWFDPAKDFEEAVQKDQDFDGVKVFIFNNDPFTIKEEIECENSKFNDPTKKYLIYCPFEKPKDEDNWLEDMYLYSDVYYADRVALTMRSLELTSVNLRSVINRHLNFFASQVRTNALKKKFILNDETTPEELELMIMSIIVKNNSHNKFDYILKEVIFDSTHNKYDELIKYGFKDVFWELVANQFSYCGNQSIDDLVYTLILTYFNNDIKFVIDSPNINAFIQTDNKENSLIFVSNIKSDPRYKELSSSVWNRFNIKDLLSTKGLDQISKTDAFEEVDEFIVDKAIASLANGSFDYDFFKRIVKENRQTSIWYSIYQPYYQFILDFIQFKNVITTKIDSDLSSQEYITQYTQVYYQIDNAYRHFVNSYEKLPDNIEDIQDNAQKLLNLVDNEYENDYLINLGYSFSRSIKDREPNYDFSSPNLSTKFYRTYLNRNLKKQFVIISDAMRYEVGVDLMNALNSEESFKGSASIKPQITTLPSITMFGMASLLPNREIDYKKGGVYVDDKPSNGVGPRNKILSDYDESFAAIAFNDIVEMTTSELRTYMKDKSVVYIYHDTIDAAGEHDTGVLEACNTAIKDIIRLIKKLYNGLQISNYLITSDHGFIYRHKKVDGTSKYPPFKELRPTDYSQRYAILDDDIKYENVNEFNMDYLGGCKKLRVMTPYGYDYFVKGGGGLQYIHGGASLQELITPVVMLSEMNARSPKSFVEPVKVILKSTIRKIMSKSFTLTFEQVEKVESKKVPIKLSIYFVDENNNPISNEVTLVANKDTDNLDDRDYTVKFNLKDLDYSRDLRYTLVMKNADTNEIVSDKDRFVIDIPKFKSLF